MASFAQPLNFKIPAKLMGFIACVYLSQFSDENALAQITILKDGQSALKSDDADEQSDLKEISAKEYCENLYAFRKIAIKLAQKELDEQPSKFEWSKMNGFAKQSVLAPFKEKLKQAKSRKLQFPNMNFLDAEMRQVFIPADPRSPFIPGARPVERVSTVSALDNRTLLGQQAGVFFSPKNPNRLLLISDIAIGPFEARESVITARGVWHRIQDATYEKSKIPHFKPWPHEAEAKAMWDKFLVDREGEDEKSERINKTKADKAKKSVDVYKPSRPLEKPKSSPPKGIKA